LDIVSLGNYFSAFSTAYRKKPKKPACSQKREVRQGKQKERIISPSSDVSCVGKLCLEPNKQLMRILFKGLSSTLSLQCSVRVRGCKIL
jgi:hypothetical protein